MADFLDKLVQEAKATISNGYYMVPFEGKYTPLGLKEPIQKFHHAAIISEIKFASPSLGVIRSDDNVEQIALRMFSGGAVAISVLTEPKHFRGSLSALRKVRKRVALPLLMKDIILSCTQIDAASAIGVDAVLLIKALFDRGYCERNTSSMIKYAHSKGMEVLLETHTKAEFESALDTDADLIGINNRDLRTLHVDLNTTRSILAGVNPKDKVVVSESGITSPHDIRLLHAVGVKAFLVGSAIMAAENIEGKVRELMAAI